MSATRADAFGALAIIGVTAAITFGPGLVARFSAHASREECEALVARYAEMKERSVSAKIDPQRYAAALEEARRAAGASFERCTREVTLDELDCTRRANNADEVERCLR